MTQEQRALVAKQYADGILVKLIAEWNGISEAHVCRVAHAAGVPRRQAFDGERWLDVIGLIDEGASYGQAARKLGLSRCAVAGIVYRARRQQEAGQ